jgi:hypothetical protein
MRGARLPLPKQTHRGPSHDTRYPPAAPPHLPRATDLNKVGKRSCLGTIPILRHGIRSSPEPTMFTIWEFRQHGFCD